MSNFSSQVARFNYEVTLTEKDCTCMRGDVGCFVIYDKDDDVMTKDECYMMTFIKM